MTEQHLTDSPDTGSPDTGSPDNGSPGTHSPGTHSPGTSGTTGSGSLTIDCAQCTERFTAACSDCVVSFVLGIGERRSTGGGAPEERPDAVVLHLSEARAVRLLAEAGLVAPLRHRRAAAGGSA